MFRMKSVLLTFILGIVLCFSGCGAQGGIESWNVEDYSKLKDIISIEETIGDNTDEIRSYEIWYKSDDCKVVSYLSIPNECLESKEAYPCIIFCRGGNRNFGSIGPKTTASFARKFGTIVYASQYRGADGGTGKDEFGGADVNDVLKLIDLCEEYAFIDMNELYMLGASRGGIMTYQAIRQDERIKKAVVVSGVADIFMTYEERKDMQKICKELIGGTPEEIPEEYEKRSATYWADELKCPVLIIHSKKDVRAGYEQAEKMAKCLKDEGMEYKFVSYEDDVHGFHPEDFEIISDWIQLSEFVAPYPAN